VELTLVASLASVVGLWVRCCLLMLALVDVVELLMQLRRRVGQQQMELMVDYGCEEVLLM
jgi:hypothetical protein